MYPSVVYASSIGSSALPRTSIWKVHDSEFDEACLFCDHRGCTQCACDTLRICGSRKVPVVQTDIH